MQPTSESTSARVHVTFRFERNEEHLAPGCESAIALVARSLTRTPRTVWVEGNTLQIEMGGLAERRARAVVEALVRAGVPRALLVATDIVPNCAATVELFEREPKSGYLGIPGEDSGRLTIEGVSPDAMKPSGALPFSGEPPVTFEVAR